MAGNTNPDTEFDFLSMSDEDILKFSPEQIEKAQSASTEEPSPKDEEDADETPADDPSADDEEDPANPEEPAAPETPEDAAEEKPAAEETPKKKTKTAAPAEGDEADKAEKPEEPVGKIDYEAAYKRLIGTPIKANGRDITLDSVDDAIQLIQMGANYNKKMAALKPNLALMKMLENNGLLNEEKISFLIDLSKKDQGAINKLVKDSGIDPLDLNADKAGEYKPGSHKVDQRELDLDAVLDEIQTTPSYNKTISVVGEKWDAASKQAIANDPQILRVINDHVQRGVYDVIADEIERERLFGRLQGMSDLEAYRKVGDAIQARGGFNHLGRQGQSKPEASKVVQPKSGKDSEKLKEKRRAAGASKPAATSSAAPQDFNPLAMSDAEFAKFNPKFS